jgi:hypothetical protein
VFYFWFGNDNLSNVKVIMNGDIDRM